MDPWEPTIACDSEGGMKGSGLEGIVRGSEAWKLLTLSGLLFKSRWNLRTRNIWLHLLLPIFQAISSCKAYQLPQALNSLVAVDLNLAMIEPANFNRGERNWTGSSTV